MRENVFRGLLIAEAALCVLFCFFKVSFAGVFPVAVAFPFAQIGAGLRALSLSGEAGNVAAVALYVLLSLLPAGLLLLAGKRRTLYREDWLLLLLSAMMFGVLYLMVNPGFITAVLGRAASGPVGKAILGGAVYSLLAGCLILRALRLFSSGSVQKLERYMAVLLGVLNVSFVFLAFYTCFDAMLSSIVSLRAGNSGNEHLLGMSYLFLVLRFMVNALPYILDVFVIFAALRLLAEMRKERYSAGAAEAAGRMSRLCVVSLTVTTLTNILFNLLQLLFAGSLMTVNGFIEIPLMSILFVLLALLLARIVAENRQLKEENDRFI